MAEQRSSRRLTRMDVLIMAAAGLLLILLVPVLLAKPRERAVRLVCAANLSQIGRAMLFYANDYEDELPRAGGPTSFWGSVRSWAAVDRYTAYGIDAQNRWGTASISSCFYLLVKYYQMPPRLFVCAADAGTVEFKLSDLPPGTVYPLFRLVDGWDFGPWSHRHCSYSYHMPFGQYALTTSGDPNLAVAADRSPWIRSPAAREQPYEWFKPDIETVRGTDEQARAGNSITHQRDGQNILFLDGRVVFETRAYCAVGKDNVYTISLYGAEGRGDPWGVPPTAQLSQAASRRDSLLVHDDPAYCLCEPSRR